MRSMPLFVLFLNMVLLFPLLIPSTSQARIDATKGRRYRISKQHGPWMIMVASLAEPSPERKTEGPSPEEAAGQLVYELRKKGIPAYTYSQEEIVDKVNTQDPRGRLRRIQYIAQQGRICVIAGNYSSVQDRKAQQTLAYIKTVHPKSWQKSGIYRRTPGRPGPLSGAFLTINPQLSPEEVQSRKRDPLLLKLNSGSEFSLLENEGRYTLVVATFFGKAQTKIGTRRIEEASRHFKVGRTLDQAGENARQLVALLRSKATARRVRREFLPALRGSQFDAYVYHGRYRSLVTVGSFDSPHDPQIANLKNLFSAKMKRNAGTGQEVLVGEVITIPGRTATAPPMKTFLFDPKPTLMEVPKLR